MSDRGKLGLGFLAYCVAAPTKKIHPLRRAQNGERLRVRR